MVDYALVQAKASYGFAKAAAALGPVCQFYRPAGATAVIVTGNETVAINALLDTRDDMQQRHPSKTEKPQDWYAGFDFTQAQPGDYLVHPALGTFAILSMEPFRPARLARCNRVLAIARPSGPAPGPGYYGGDVTAYETPLLTGWPAGLVIGTKGEKPEVTLPGDTLLAWLAVTLPPSVPVVLRAGDVITDDQVVTVGTETAPMRYTVSAAELTATGWRLTAASAIP